MIKNSFREHHLFTLLESYSETSPPFDVLMSRYFRAHKSLGSKDRAEIAESIYGMIRWQRLLDHLNKGKGNWRKRYEAWETFDPENYLEDSSIPLAIRVSCPDEMFQLYSEVLGEEQAAQFCLANNSPAPTTVRANPLKTTRDDLLKSWTGTYQVRPCEVSPLGIIFDKKINFFGLPEFKAGLFEVQDEGSQLLADMMDVKPGQLVMDYCSGSGGKTLAFAHKMEHKGQIYLHDIRAHILDEARKRLRRAGIQNAQVIQEDSPKLRNLKKKMDWILVDAPCSGTGTWRRNPEMKWKSDKAMVERLVGQQRMIFEKALSFLKPGGHIVYGTCSVLPQENEEQIAHFVKTYDLKVQGTPFSSLPAPGKMDGFFGCVLKK